MKKSILTVLIVVSSLCLLSIIPGCGDADTVTEEMTYSDAQGNEITKEEYDRLMAETLQQANAPPPKLCLDAAKVREYCHMQQPLHDGGPSCGTVYRGEGPYYNTDSAQVDVRYISKLTVATPAGDREIVTIPERLQYNLEIENERRESLNKAPCERYPHTAIPNLGDEAIFFNSVSCEPQDLQNTGAVSIWVRQGEKYLAFEEVWGDKADGCSVEEATALIREVVLLQIN